MGYEWDTYGGVVGIDKTFGNALVGLSFGYSDTDVDADRYTETDIDTYNLGIYGTYSMGALWLDGGFSYAWGDIESDRKVAFLSRTASSDAESDTWTLYGGLGYDYVTGNWTITPSLMLKYSDYDQDDYTEKGAAGANLHVNDFSQDSFTSTLGVDVAYQIQQNLKLNFRAAWVHEYCDNQSVIKANFANAQTFKTKGLDPADNSGIFGVGLEGELQQGVTAYVDYDYEVKSDFDAHNVTAGMRFDF
jgi:outer membrane autotransporter protein